MTYMKYNFEDLYWLFNLPETRDLIRLDLDEAAYLYKLVKSINNPLCVEIGRLFGGSTILMASAGGRIISIDDLSAKSIQYDTKYDRELKEKLKELNLNNVEIIVANSSTYPNEDIKPDIIFIDGNHTYNGVKADCEHWLPVAKKHILFHDSCTTRSHTGARTEVIKFVKSIQLEKVKEIGSITHFIV